MTALLPAAAAAADSRVAAADNLAWGFAGAHGLVQMALEPGGGADAAMLDTLAARMRGAGVTVATSPPPAGQARDHY